MRSLQELAKIVSEYRLDNVAAFNVYNRKDKSSKYNQFLDGILSQEFMDDDTAADKLYQVSKDDIKYRVLKNRLKQRIYNNVLFIYSGKRASSPYWDAWLSLYRHSVVAKFLVSIGAKNAGNELMHKVLQKAEKYQLHDIVQQCSLHFRRQSMLVGNLKKFDEYNSIFKKATDSMVAEAKAEELYYTLALQLNRTFTHSADLIEQAKNNAEQLTALSNEVPSDLVRYYEHSLKSIYFQLINDYRSAITSCDNFEKYLKDNPVFYNDNRMVSVLVTKGSCYLHLNEFAEGIKCAEKALKLSSEGTENWFSLLELHFLLLLNSNDLDKATDVYILAANHPRLNYIRPQQQETWKIFGGYLWFMLNYYHNEKCINKLSNQKQGFRFSKLLNEIPNFSKDKKGMNVAVLILQILLLLEKKEYVKIISRTEALKSYIYRNLHKDDAYRSHFFIKMILTMEKAQFDYDDTIEKTKGQLEKLKESNLNYASTHTRMEIIPYERLWGIVLDLIN
jgi:tetratricopeptide (TPR) repeat protein